MLGCANPTDDDPGMCPGVLKMVCRGYDDQPNCGTCGFVWRAIICATTCNFCPLTESLTQAQRQQLNDYYNQIGRTDLIKN